MPSNEAERPLKKILVDLHAFEVPDEPRSGRSTGNLARENRIEFNYSGATWAAGSLGDGRALRHGTPGTALKCRRVAAFSREGTVAVGSARVLDTCISAKQAKTQLLRSFLPTPHSGLAVHAHGTSIHVCRCVMDSSVLSTKTMSTCMSPTQPHLHSISSVAPATQATFQKGALPGTIFVLLIRHSTHLSSFDVLFLPSNTPSRHLILPHLASLYLTSPHLTSPHLTSPYLTSHHLTSHRPTSPHLTSPHLILPHLASHRHTSPHLTSPCLT
jgi:hypothetical protein